MGILRKADFYYGSMLSMMINKGYLPAIIEPGNSQILFRLVTNKGGEYQIYAKYVSSSIRQTKGLWQFSFSRDEIDSIRNHEGKANMFFALICGMERLQDSEIAILAYKEAVDCLDINYVRDQHRITVKYEKNAHGLKVYGTGRADFLNGEDNTIKIPRDRLALF